MSNNHEAQSIRGVIAVLRITVGVILLVTWWENLQGGIYTADGITGLFNDIFNDNGGGPAFYRSAIQATILQAPGAFAAFQLVAEFLLGAGLIVGALTPLVGLGATLFFLNLFLAYFGGHEWIWTYVLLTSAAFTVAFTRSGRAFGLDQMLVQSQGEPPIPYLW